MDTFQQIKDRFTIFDAWQRLGLPNPPHRDGVYRSPFREDRNPTSFSVSLGGTRWKDFATGEGGDVADFWATGRGITLKEARKELVEILGGTAGNWTAAPRQAPRHRQEDKKPPTLPALRKPTAAEIRHIAQLRGVDVAGVAWSAGVGILRIGEHLGQPSWFYVDGPDGTITTVEARRMDGEHHKKWDGTTPKADSLKGSTKAWPIGGSLLFNPRMQWKTVIITEGFPDMLALLGGLVEAGLFNALPLAILGSAQRIHPRIIERIKGMKIVIFPHRGEAGEEAIGKWHKLISSEVEVCKLPEFKMPDGTGGNDLNDFIRAGYGEALVTALQSLKASREGEAG